MLDSLFGRVVVPVANPDDAAATATALRPYLDGADSTVIVVHVIEKAGGAPDKASVQQRKEYAADVFLAFTGELSETKAAVETQILYGTDTAEAIIDGAHEQNASAIVFTPRGQSRGKNCFPAMSRTNSSRTPIFRLSSFQTARQTVPNSNRPATE